MSIYPVYARPAQSVDIPANPGYRVRKNTNYSPPSAWYDVVAWRIAQDPSQPRLGLPIVLGAYGLEILTADPNYREALEFALPGQEVTD